ncbi:hypothetical protein AVEN_215272-1 [Araneus ventricosus]|uniref:Mos1 transposase HTH domain-containing protein n=1 Tax=Araneus ventricosus TaxID=182803 RepID=A0A4Y2J665_ARAVE|nr:hypothetical protein AVEN_215272-1 [Araneus ventricosus]
MKAVKVWCTEFNKGRRDVRHEQRPEISSESWEHTPYGLDLSSSDNFYLFGPLKKQLEGWQFRTIAEIQQTILTWLNDKTVS